ncbi:ethylene-responsive transcription factor-like protein At4g13040 isoform X2 [Benincasa hispida]|uniref:ethylene-responsive transcription factor-like protein At4g13040 isoform X2 n=1 Tax=Benincasa hispida TaxID=102211 RepID=UPI001901877E|nr:ethylene-responsive transcription factor-like protein At4g13040 isoform X2 [Benincasa hispida]XP_038899854.1 ethylene-responsive transcription factor-like protein At4g13040 isoform X2 [Benincasa hispida]XP_038899855.1 ethylene-responsive transcription factor-like protein At4g13040 isoform X2 [Benincasa hispida]
MVSLRRRRLLGLCSGKSSFVTPLPKFSENGTTPENPSPSNKLVTLHPKSSDDVNITDRSSIENMESSFANALDWTSLNEQSNQPISGHPLKHRKRHRRKNSHNQELSIMRGVYFKNMKWQAAIKVDKKQIHLGTFGSQEEAARLYDRAAYVCGREPNFELSEEEKQELQKFKWEDFLAMTRHAITNKKHKRLGTGSSPKKLGASSLQIDNTEFKHRFNEPPVPEDINFT